MLNDDYTDSMRNCLGLIERHAARLMRSAGGSLQGTNQTWTPSTQAERNEAIRLYTHNLDSKATALALNRSDVWVRRVVKAAGCEMRLQGGLRKNWRTATLT